MIRPLALAAAALVVAACPPKDSGAAAPPRPAPAPSQPEDFTAEHHVPPPMPTGRVVLRDAFGGSHPVEVEIAATSRARTRGMMWRKELAPGKGMLFIFPREAFQSFWMRNTLIPLDMIFITQDGVVAGVVENAVPKTLDARGVSKPSTYVLEVPGGWAQKVGVKAGCAVDLGAARSITPEP